MRSGTNLPRVGGYNRAVILDAIRRQDQVSRVELADLTGLTSQTVSNIVRRLLDEGLITESGHAPSRGGKRRTFLSLRPDAYYSVGLHLDPDATVTVLVDLSGRILARSRRRTPVGATTDPHRLVRGAATAVNAVIESAGVDRDLVLGMGVASPGPFDTRRGLVVDPPNLAGWHEVPLSETLGTATGLPVVIDNDATAAAVGEQWVGGAARAGSFLFLYLGTGIGAGIIAWDRVIRGDSGNAGEFGHIVVVPDGWPCHCGARGCLEAHCSPRGMLADLLERHGKRCAERLRMSLRDDAVRSDYTKLCRAARLGDRAALDTVTRAAERIGGAALTAVNLLDISRIVLGGEALRGIEEILRASIDRTVNGYSIARKVRTVTVEPSMIGTDAGAVGAASLVLHGTYAPGWQMMLLGESDGA